LSAPDEGGEDSRMARRRTTEEISDLIGQYRSSGLSQQRYCEQHGINLSTLGRYLRRHGGGQRLVRVRVRPEAEPESAPGAGFALVLANGRRIESGWRFAGEALAQLIRLVEAV
jgi:hypothetical protein